MPRTIKCKGGGTLLEAFKDDDFQLTVRTVPPGTKAGGHLHPKANEVWIVVRGDAVIRRELGLERQAVLVSGNVPTVIEVPAGTGHEIENVGALDVVLTFWSDRPWEPEDVEEWSWT